jgi:methionyl aminopeptidase
MFSARSCCKRHFFQSNTLFAPSNRTRLTIKARFSTVPRDFGDYHVILPPEPYIWGVSHITPRAVPPNIARPPYALPDSLPHTTTRNTFHDGVVRADTSGDKSVIALGGYEERRLRNAARLAKKVLEYAGSLVQVSRTYIQVCTSIPTFFLPLPTE